MLALPLSEADVTVECVGNPVGGPLIGTARWLGVPLDRLLARAGVHPGATQVVGRSVDGFTVGFPTAAALDGRVALLAVGMNGQPLPIEHGFPARLIVAGLYGYVSATKWVTELELTTFEAFDAFWVPRDWAQQAPIKIGSRIAVPRPNRTLAPGTSVVAGVAWAPPRGISGVEIQVDDGPWRPARLAQALGPDTWVQWVLSWEAQPGLHRIRVRARDADGQLQDPQDQPPAPAGASGYHSVVVTVSGA